MKFKNEFEIFETILLLILIPIAVLWFFDYSITGWVITCFYEYWMLNAR